MEQSEIERGLRDLGLKRGDIVLVHSSLSSLGHVEGGAQAVVDALLAVLGETGTLVVPTFGMLGRVTEVVRNDPRAVHSGHPLAGVAAIGPDARGICRDHTLAETAHGPGTPYLRIAEMGGYVCLLGVDQDRNTTLHTVEELLRLPYLKDRTVTFSTPDGEVTRTVRRFPGPHRDFLGLDRLLRDHGVIRIGRIGNAVVRLMSSRRLIDTCLEIGRRDPAFVLCDNPSCEDCRSQLADIWRDRLKSESFTLVASSGLAGRNVIEMISGLHAAGVDCIELDTVGDSPVHLLANPDFASVVRALREGGTEVTAVRCPSPIPDFEHLLDRMLRVDVRRLVMPLTHHAPDQAQAAAERGITVSFFNSGRGSEAISKGLLELADGDAPVRFTFNAANFARVGEKPFLHSFRQKLHRYVDQIDLEDATFDGTTRLLGQGNAEIKEIISALRCRSFAGPMVLTSANDELGDVRDAAERFHALLEAM